MCHPCLHPYPLTWTTVASSSLTDGGQPNTLMAQESSSSSVMTGEGQPKTGGRSCNIVTTNGRQPDTLLTREVMP